jgi:hypothetical protein
LSALARIGRRYITSNYKRSTVSAEELESINLEATLAAFPRPESSETPSVRTAVQYIAGVCAIAVTGPAARSALLSAHVLPATADLLRLVPDAVLAAWVLLCLGLLAQSAEGRAVATHAGVQSFVSDVSRAFPSSPPVQVQAGDALAVLISGVEGLKVIRKTAVLITMRDALLGPGRVDAHAASALLSAYAKLALTPAIAPKLIRHGAPAALVVLTLHGHVPTVAAPGFAFISILAATPTQAAQLKRMGAAPVALACGIHLFSRALHRDIAAVAPLRLCLCVIRQVAEAAGDSVARYVATGACAALATAVVSAAVTPAVLGSPFDVLTLTAAMDLLLALAETDIGAAAVHTAGGTAALMAFCLPEAVRPRPSPLLPVALRAVAEVAIRSFGGLEMLVQVAPFTWRRFLPSIGDCDCGVQQKEELACAALLAATATVAPLAHTRRRTARPQWLEDAAEAAANSTSVELAKMGRRAQRYLVIGDVEAHRRRSTLRSAVLGCVLSLGTAAYMWTKLDERNF